MLVLYNTDYDDELKAASDADVSAVQESARAVEGALAAAGYASELVGIHGDDLDRVVGLLTERPPDLVFNLVESLRGTTRNEPVMPALFEMFEIPFTGPGPLCLRLCLHKDRARDVLAASDVSIPGGLTLREPGDLDDPALDALDYPFFVKLSREDASIGIEGTNVVADAAALRVRAGELFAKYGQPLIAERFIGGREFNVTVIGNDGDLRILPLHEIDFGKMPAGSPHIVSYAAKWDGSHPDYAGTKPVPMREPTAALEEAIEKIAVRAFRALELRDFARVDLRIDDGGAPHVIDVNPNCDLSPDAGVARAAAAAGHAYHELIGTIAEIAWSRYVGRDSRAGHD